MAKVCGLLACFSVVRESGDGLWPRRSLAAEFPPDQIDGPGDGGEEDDPANNQPPGGQEFRRRLRAVDHLFFFIFIHFIDIY